MTFRMDKKKNLLVLVTVIFLLVVCLVALYAGWIELSRVVRRSITSVLVTAIVLLSLDFKKEVTVSEAGFYMYSRRRQYNLDWKQIRRLEYSGKKWAPAFNTMIIHTSNGHKLYVDYTFKDYKKAWLCIAQHYQTYGEQPIIDKEIWEISEEEST